MPECARNTNEGCPVNTRLGIRVKDLLEGAAGAGGCIEKLRGQIENFQGHARYMESALEEATAINAQLKEKLQTCREALVVIRELPAGREDESSWFANQALKEAE